MDDIREYLYYLTDKQIEKMKIAHVVELTLSSTANREYFPNNMEECATTVFKRLAAGDISMIFLDYFVGEEECYSVSYEDIEGGVLGSPNKNQKTVVLDNGNLHITISDTDGEV